MRSASFTALLPSLLAASVTLPAQTLRPPGTIVGFVVDSIRRAPLGNAYVALEGTAFGATTDSGGRFVIADVPAGSYRAVLMHELLDVMHMGVRTEPVTVRSGDTLRLFVGLPSASTVLRRRCGIPPQGADTAALFGAIVGPGGEPAGGATVLLSWRQVIVSREAGVREARQHRAAVSLPDGTFQVCGLPDDLAADARVARGTDTSGIVPVRIPLTGVSIVQLGLPEPGGEPAGGRRGTAIISGRVLDSQGAPVAGARVSILDEEVANFTDSTGRFALGSRRAGSQTVMVRRIGYELRELPLLLRAGEPTELQIVLQDFVPLLDEVIVRVRRDAALERVGFGARARVGSGYYLRPEELERRHVARLSDYLTEVPLLRVTGGASNRRVSGVRGAGEGCVAYAVDGQRWTGPPPDEALNPGEVAAIEVYPRGLAPALFLGINECAVVVIWTRTRLGL